MQRLRKQLLSNLRPRRFAPCRLDFDTTLSSIATRPQSPLPSRPHSWLPSTIPPYFTLASPHVHSFPAPPYLILVSYLYGDGLQQAEPLMSISSVLPMRVQTILERVNRRCIKDILWKFVPVLDHSLTKEVLS